MPLGHSALQSSLEDKLGQVQQALAALEAEQARDHEALRLLAAGSTKISRESSERSRQAEHMLSRLESVEERLQQALLLLLSPTINPPERTGSPEEFVRGTEIQQPIIDDLEEQRLPVDDAALSGDGAVPRTWITATILGGIAAALLILMFRLLSG